MQLETASRKRVKIKLALQGPSGSGKTKSALYVAYGLCPDWSKIAVIDTENRSSELYSDVGPFRVIHLSPPYSPEHYIQALDMCLAAGIEVIVIDSMSHEWDYIIETHGAMLGNSFTNWSKVTPRHNAFVNAMLQADAHIIGNIRTKQDYVLSDKGGKMVPEKVGLKGVQRDSVDYEFTIVLDLSMSLNAKASKDRTGLFFNKPEFIPSQQTGTAILAWCNQGEASVTASKESMLKAIDSCKTIEELSNLFNNYPAYQLPLKDIFSARRVQLTKPNLPPQNFSANATHHR